MKTTLSPYLMFNGNAREALTFYHSIFGGELSVQTYGEAMPGGTPPEMKDRVIHATMQNGALSFMASDGSGTDVNVGDNVHLSLVGSDERQLTDWFNALAAGGRVDMPLEKQFWGDTFGTLTNRFGIHWMVNVASEQPTGG
jgi:PhnB protein